jgi:mercuric ion transport protein
MAVAGVATLLASACCVLPLVLVLAGLGGAWLAQLAPLKPWAPWFTGLALAALAGAGWTVYRGRAQCGPDGQACALAPRWLRPLYWIVAVLALAMLAFPLIAPWFY